MEKDRSEFKLNFDLKLYSKEAVLETITAYKGVADFLTKEKNGRMEVIIKDFDSEYVDILDKEFANYVLAETVNLRNKNA